MNIIVVCLYAFVTLKYTSNMMGVFQTYLKFKGLSVMASVTALQQ
uniref:Uncharacterized protein n=1 Tax=Ascaris lumbricoides TaxID=6252 RepID=A0A9J2PVP3_ASCLU